MPEQRTRAARTALQRTLDTGAELLSSERGREPASKSLNAHFAAVRSGSRCADDTDAFCDAVRARKITPLAPLGVLLGAQAQLMAAQAIPGALSDAAAMASARTVATQALVAVADAIEALTVETDDQGRPTTAALIDAFRAGADPDLVELALLAPGGPRAAAISLRRQAAGAREPGRQVYAIPGWEGVDTAELARAVERLTRTRLSVEIRVGATRLFEPSTPAFAINLARYAVGGEADLQVLANELGAASRLFPECAVLLTGLSAAVMSRGLAFDSDEGISFAEGLCGIAALSVGALQPPERRSRRRRLHPRLRTSD